MTKYKIGGIINYKLNQMKLWGTHMKVILDSFTEIQDVKKIINEKCNEVMKEINVEFREQRVKILKQIDIYVQDINKQLKGTKTTNEYGNEHNWCFENRDRDKDRDSGSNTYPTYVALNLESESNDFKYRIALSKNWSGEKSYYFTIENGHLKLCPCNDLSGNGKEVVESWIFQYEHEFIAQWKNLKKDINDKIMSDFTKTQERINKRLNNAQKTKDIYDNFEV